MKKIIDILSALLIGVIFTAVFFGVLNTKRPVVEFAMPGRKCIRVIGGDFVCDDYQGKEYDIMYRWRSIPNGHEAAGVEVVYE